MPARAKQMPHSRLTGMASPKSRQPPTRMTIVLLCPTTAAPAHRHAPNLIILHEAGIYFISLSCDYRAIVVNMLGEY